LREGKDPPTANAQLKGNRRNELANGFLRKNSNRIRAGGPADGSVRYFEMGNFDRMRDVRKILHIDRDHSFIAGLGRVENMRAQLHQKKTGLPGMWAPVGDLGEPSDFLQ